MNKKQTLYDHLDASGILESGSAAEIAEMRKQFRRQYKAAWRKQKRKAEKEYTISLSPAEHKIIAQIAQKHHRSPTRFIKEAVLAYCKKQFLNPDPMTLNYIREQLILTYNVIQQLEEEQHLSTATEQALIQKLEVLETTILEKLKNPESLEETLIEAIRQNPERKAYFFEILESGVP